MNTDYANSPVVKIKVLGCGGAGNNSIDRMIEENMNLDGVEFTAINTDRQVLNRCRAVNKLCIGEKLCKGQGCGGDPAVGQLAAEESIEDIRNILQGADLVFITAGMGGGTGTGTAPVVAQAAREMGILTVSVVSKPFDFEGAHRTLNAEIGIKNLEQFVDANIVVPNQKLVETYPTMGMKETFKKADEVLQQGVLGLADLIVTTMTINLDFADIKSILKTAGKAHIGLGSARGENRVLKAISSAISNPLLETNIRGATGIILSVQGGNDLALNEVSHCGTLVRDLVDPGCRIIFGVNLLPNIVDEVKVLIVAVGFQEYAGKIDIEPEQQEEDITPYNVPEPEAEPAPAPIQKPAKRPSFFDKFKNFRK